MCFMIGQVVTQLKKIIMHAAYVILNKDLYCGLEFISKT